MALRSSPTHPPWPRPVSAGLAVWLLAAVAISVSGVYENVPAPVIGATNAGLTALSLLAVAFVPSVRAWARTVSLRVLVGYHVVRFVGIAFLVLYARGVIPGAFAITAGWGDIAVAITALLVVTFALPVASLRRWWTVLVWNVLGLADILLVVGTGLRLGLGDAAQMNWITVFPLSLLPLFIVPLVIATHVVIFWRLGLAREQTR